MNEFVYKFLYVLIGATLFGLLWLITLRRRYRATSVQVNIPFGLGSITLQPSMYEREIAWKLYIEMRTRKAALLFDDQYDVINEIYDSLYQLFPLIRDMLSAFPPEKIARSERLISILMRVQADGLRPHLTRWQAAFRRWWDQATNSPENSFLTPQEIQRQYPFYKELTADLKVANTELLRLSDELLAIAIPPKHKFIWPWKRAKILPEAPTISPDPKLIPE